MTSKQVRIYQELLKAKTYKEIAEKFYISTETVKSHCRNIYRQYGVRNRDELMALVINNDKGIHINK